MSEISIGSIIAAVILILGASIGLAFFKKVFGDKNE